MHPYIEPLAEQFSQYANATIAAGQAAYMRNQFAFFGIKTPLRRQISKTYMKQILPDYAELPDIAKEMWALPEREYQYVAIELVAAMHKKWTPEIIQLAEHMIVHKSWWDSVDAINSAISGPFFKKFPEQIKSITRGWNRSDNIWLQRSSILFQLTYKTKTDRELLAKYILRHTASKAFFVQKAIGWALRQYSATDPHWVEDFVTGTELAPLSRREALRNI